MTRISLFLFFAIAVLGCGGAETAEERPQAVDAGASGAETGFIEMNETEPVSVLLSGEELAKVFSADQPADSTVLCLDWDSSAWPHLTVLRAGYESAACLPVAYDERRYSTITDEESHKFFIYGEPGIEYRLGILRVSGYVTLSHREGAVMRDSDVFVWRVVASQSGVPAVMRVRSLTPESAFQFWAE